MRSFWLCAAISMLGCPRNGSDTNGPEGDDTPTVIVPGTLPNVKTPGNALSTAALQHVELVRITRNFGKSNFEIALDAWVPIDNPRDPASPPSAPEIADVRMWWAVSDRDGERGPFSEKSRDHFDMDYERLAPDKWRVDLGSDKHVYRFFVEYDETGTPAAYADVDADGTKVEHCRITKGNLAARKLFGAPVGIRNFEVTCVDAEGNERSGNMVDMAD